MAKLIEAIPDVNVLIALAPEELAPFVLAHVKEFRQNSNLHRQDIGDSLFERTHGYPNEFRSQVELAISEAWEWLRISQILIPVDGSNSQGGWMRLSRRGAKLKTPEQFKAHRDAVAFPKEQLHPLIADKVWLALARGDLDDAVFAAFKAVEVQVREAGGFPDTEIGVQLMRKAFDKNSGPLTKMSQLESERESLAHLFAGAVGSYKNPHSHRTVTIADVREAQEMVILASHLLRIVDARRK